MGLVNSIAQKYVSKAIIDIIKEKCPPVYIFIDSLDEVSLSKAIGLLLQEERRLSLQVIEHQVIKIDEIKKQIEIMEYVIRFLLGDEPAMVTLASLIKALGIEEVSDVNITEFLANLSRD